MSTILVVVLILLILGAVGTGPWFPYAKQWGYRWTGALGIAALILAVFMLSGRMPY